MLDLCRALRQDVIDHANRVRRNLAVSPCPLHNGVHALAVRLALPPSFGNTQVSSVLIHCAACFPLLPAGFESAMKFPRRLLESERGGSNTGGLLFAE